jgi:hypothetical protein
MKNFIITVVLLTAFGCGFATGAAVLRQPKPGCAMCTAKCSCCNCPRKTPVKFLYYNPQTTSCGCKDGKK